MTTVSCGCPPHRWGKPIVLVGSLGAVLAGSYVIMRCFGRPLDRTALMGLVIAVVGAGMCGYALGEQRSVLPAQAGTTPQQIPGHRVPADDPTTTTARAQEVTWLADIASVDGGEGWRHGASTIEARAYERSVIGSTCFETDDTAEAFNLGKRFQRFHAIIGMADDAPTASATRFTVFVDGQVVFTRDLVLGEIAEIDAPALGVEERSLTHSLGCNPESRCWKQTGSCLFIYVVAQMTL